MKHCRSFAGSFVRSLAPRAFVFASLLVTVAAVPSLAQTLQVTPSKPAGVYGIGEKIVWNIAVTGDNAALVRGARFLLKHDGGTVAAEGSISLAGGRGNIETAPTTKPVTYLAEIIATGADGKPLTTTDGKPLRALGGAAVAPGAIQPALPRPADFDAFWTRKLNELAAVRMNPEVQPVESGREGVEYAKVTLDNIGGAKVRTQIARPKTGTKFPALIILQWAGVYGLPKTNVTNYAAQGWLTMNVMAHDLPLDRDAAFYKTANETTLKDYVSIGNSSRETSYFLKMLLGCYRASEYLASRPDWDGRTLVAMGTSQGGLQSIALAGLQPRVSAVMVNVPAGADTGGKLAGRGVSWPYWANHAPWNRKPTDTLPGSEASAAIVETSRYFDAVNFASRIRVPSLVALGLLDVTSSPSGVFALANQIKGAKEIVVMPLSEHQDRNGTQAPFYQRSTTWLNALKTGSQPPIERAF